MACFDERQARIREQVQPQAAGVDARAEIDDELLDEVTALVEWPVALTGRFEERFLQVPAEALMYSMKEHQKYFHVVDSQGRLLPHFITVANMESKDPAQVIDGNERVIRPRLADADFFFRTDQKIALAQRVRTAAPYRLPAAAGHPVRQNRCASSGSRVRWRRAVGSRRRTRPSAPRCLCKTDLVTEMVGEFADMQGIAGRYYALNDGEAPAVAEALQQQYWPRFAGDKLPQDPVATCLALADRLDTLVGIFGIGQSPTGSRDPFALRRASLGVLRIIVEGELPLDLEQSLREAADQYADGTLAEGTVETTFAYMLERFRAWVRGRADPGPGVPGGSAPSR